MRCVEWPDYTPRRSRRLLPKPSAWSAVNCPPPPWAAASSLNCADARPASPSSSSSNTMTIRSSLICAVGCCAGQWIMTDTLRDAKPSDAGQHSITGALIIGASCWRSLTWPVVIGATRQGKPQSGSKVPPISRTIGVRLLTDIKRIFDDPSMVNVDCILSATLVEKLKADEEAPWIDMVTRQRADAEFAGHAAGRRRRTRPRQSRRLRHSVQYRPSVQRCSRQRLQTRRSLRTCGRAICQPKFLPIPRRGRIDRANVQIADGSRTTTQK